SQQESLLEPEQLAAFFDLEVQDAAQLAGNRDEGDSIVEGDRIDLRFIAWRIAHRRREDGGRNDLERKRRPNKLDVDRVLQLDHQHNLEGFSRENRPDVLGALPRVVSLKSVRCD